MCFIHAPNGLFFFWYSLHRFGTENLSISGGPADEVAATVVQIKVGAFTSLIVRGDILRKSPLAARYPLSFKIGTIS